MRLAYEVRSPPRIDVNHLTLFLQLGFTSSSLFTRSHVRFLSLDGISFAKPVPIGSILRLTSHILHTSSTPEFPTLVVSAPPHI